jgi:hypothetical protein
MTLCKDCVGCSAPCKVYLLGTGRVQNCPKVYAKNHGCTLGQAMKKFRSATLAQTAVQ